MEASEFCSKIGKSKVYVFAKSMNEISNELVQWAEKEGIVDQAEFSLIDDLYEIKDSKRKYFPHEFSKAPDEVKDRIMEYTERQGKVTLNDYDGDRVYKFVRNYR